MDLLGLEGSSSEDESSSSPDFCGGNDDDRAEHDGGKQPDYEPEPDPPATKKRKRGCVSIVPSSQAPTSLFTRSVPHRRGHWSGHVMVPVTCFSSKTIERSILKFQKRLEKQGFSGTIVRHDQIHLSLSKSFSLQLGCIDSFVQQLTTRLTHERSTRCFVDRSMCSSGGDVLVNDEKTRSFWGWRVVQPNATLTRLVRHVDAVLKSYNQPSYYDPPIFHISLASFPGNVCDLEEDEEEEDEEDSSDDDDDDESDYIQVNLVQCKFGTNKNYVIGLQP
jgi:hypothetical protein